MRITNLTTRRRKSTSLRFSSLALRSTASFIKVHGAVALCDGVCCVVGALLMQTYTVDGTIVFDKEVYTMLIFLTVLNKSQF